MESSGKSWLELTTGKSVPLLGTCTIGRAHSSRLVLDDEKVSRHHALIQPTGTNGCWIIDLGSANGTYVNHRRIEHAMLLRDLDEITIGPDRIIFRSSDPRSVRLDDTGTMNQTVHEVGQLTAWLFLVDVIDSTGIGRRLGPHVMAKTFADWLAHCRAVLDASGGIIDKPLGDGFLAFWPTTERTSEQMAETLLAFGKLQAASDLPFRMVLHQGVVFTGGQMAAGVYRLFGSEVNLTFRMEGLAKSLKINCLISGPAMEALGPHVTTTPAGSHRLPGVDDSLPFYSL